MKFLSLLIAPWPHLFFWCSLFLASLFVNKKRSFILLQFALTMGFIMFFTGLMKMGFAKPRPDLLMNDFRSFPSSHAAIAFGLAMLMRKPIYFILAIPLVSTRIFLKRHDLIDVSVGSLVGIGTAIWIKYTTMKYQKQIRQAIGLPDLEKHS